MPRHTPKYGTYQPEREKSGVRLRIREQKSGSGSSRPYLVGAGILGGENLALHATVAKTAGHEQTMGRLHLGPRVLVLLGVLGLVMPRSKESSMSCTDGQSHNYKNNNN
jgi:hypothetical protein